MSTHSGGPWRHRLPPAAQRSPRRLAAQGAHPMSVTSRRARYAVGSTAVALLLALLVGALLHPRAASADPTGELARVSCRPAGARGLTGWRPDNAAPFDARRAYGWVRD